MSNSNRRNKRRPRRNNKNKNTSIARSMEYSDFEDEFWEEIENERRTNPHPVYVPITFHGLQTLISHVWPHLKVIVKSQILEDPLLLPTLRKVLMYVAEAKLGFANQCSTFQNIFQYRKLYLPKPLAMYIDAIGMFSLQGQTIQPRLTKHKNAFAFNVAPSSMDAWLQHHATPVVKDEDFLYSQDRLKEFNFKWEEVEDRVRLSPSDVEFYSGFPTYEQLDFITDTTHTFHITYPNFFVPCDISTGLGSTAQAVRFVDLSPSGERDYYLLRNIPHADEAIAPFFLLGEDGGDAESPLVGDIRYCYKRGQAQPAMLDFLLV